MCDEAVIVKGSGSLYLGGPPLVKVYTHINTHLENTCPYMCVGVGCVYGYARDRCD